MKHLPLDVQSFEDMIVKNYLYIDKTEYIYNLITIGSCYFLAHPRRFGKTLLTSTLKALFSAKKELFNNLWIAKSNYDWKKYPVISIDLGLISNKNQEEFNKELINRIRDIGKDNNIEIKENLSLKATLIDLIKKLSKINRVVILIDEYDKAILDNIEAPQKANEIQNILKDFFSTLKGLYEHIHFIFITGITRFSRTSLFSGLNHLRDISEDKLYDGLLGYTQKEIDSLEIYIEKLSKEQNLSSKDTREEIKNWYNGYRFSQRPLAVYNPFSVFNCLHYDAFKNYWFTSGTPSYLIKIIKANNYQFNGLNLENLDGIETGDEIKQIHKIEDLKLIPLLFQAGYLTIKSYNSLSKNYTLGYPNYEVKASFLHLFATEIFGINGAFLNNTTATFIKSLYSNDLETFIKTFKSYLSNIPYNLHIPLEAYYHTVFYNVMALISPKANAEIPSSLGRSDIIIEINNHIYIIEFKINQSAKIALDQIKFKKYHEKFLNSNKLITLIGISFDTKKRNISDWISEDLDQKNYK